MRRCTAFSAAMEQRDRDHSRYLAKQSDHIVAFAIRRESQCGQCGLAMADGALLTLRGEKALCMQCAGMGDLVVLPSGEAALTRRASKWSSRKAVVVRWARARKRYERIGTLVEEPAIAKAKTQCAADEEKRTQKNAKAAVKREQEDKLYQEALLAELRRLFPRCPEAEAKQIALHACEKHSGRVGRSAAAKELDEQMIRLAVIAHIRHTHTGYDRMIDTVGKEAARRVIQDTIERVLGKWETGDASVAS